ncbi:MAG: S10 family peptidase [Phycisphaerae bacterium]
MRTRHLIALFLAATTLGTASAWSQTTRPTEDASAAPTPTTLEANAPSGVTTSHTLQLPDATLRYEATADVLPVADEAGETLGEIFYTYYRLLDDAGEPLPADERPITYVFNGGPGAASVWLHLGTAGPRVITMPPDGMPAHPPYRLSDNPDTWLDQTDLVFIDPVGTGFSRPATPDLQAEFSGVEQDVEAVGHFIRLHLTRAGRWGSATYLAGESYGTTRAALLAEHLHDAHGIDLNGVMLISVVLNFQTLSPGGFNDLPYVLFLPTYTATAHYHGRLAEDLQATPLPEVLAAAERFAIQDYLPALAAGSSADAATRQRVAQQLAMLTGLEADYILESNLRVAPSVFRQRLLRDTDEVVGRFDSRVRGVDLEPARDDGWFDPSYNGVIGLYTSTYNQYVASELDYRTDTEYRVLANVRPWDYGDEPYVNAADDLRRAMVKVPGLRVLVASGTYDMATPYFAADYTVNHMNLPPRIMERFVQTYYPGGHMMYHVTEARKQLDEDVAAFVAPAE